ncbi:hypothetical protein AK88_04924 [Plasmodium fragile]|uniref:RRM domain-containing protein n=1 Tax=Plasmodium fragile TaxID=5857 RepID=A0A0D9QIA3_PLAFR|nr:uncharacterized protein AK88_04924 [Plasmodium fragile]KJP85451.1 hypothetical protein AK88_04924 [Plasmodium fragile]
MSTSEEIRKEGYPCEEGKGFFFLFRKNRGVDKGCADEAALGRGAPQDSSNERGRQDQDLRKSGSQAGSEDVEHSKEEEGTNKKKKQGKEDRVEDGSKGKYIKGGTPGMNITVSTLEERDALNEATRSPHAGDVSPESYSDQLKFVHNTTKDFEDDGSQMAHDTATMVDNTENGPNGKNDMGLHELNEHSNHSDDASNVNKCKSEIDNRIKRKMHPLKQNEEKKKKKTDIDNAPSIASDSSDKENMDSNDNFSNNSTTAMFNNKDKDDTKEKKKFGSKEDHVIFADEALKGYPRIFVTRLPFEAGKKDLEKYFSKYGKIVDIYVSKNLSNNKNKGFGFVSFEKQISMDNVLKDKLHIICGKEIVVDVASMRDSKTKHLFHLPSDHYLSKYPRNDKKSPSRTSNNYVNMNKYHSVHNKTTNIRDMSKNVDNNLVMQNFYNLCPTYNVPDNRMNNKNAYKNNMPMTFFPPAGYNMDMTYFNNQQMPYQNCMDYMSQEYYWNMANYYNWNNMMFHNENMYNTKKMEYPEYVEYPYYACNGQYMNQTGLPPTMGKNKLPPKTCPTEESNLKYPTSVVPSGSYHSPGQPFVRKLPGGDEWNKRGYKLFVTKLNSVTTIETLRKYFEAFGEIIDIYMPNDVCTNRPRGIAFVTFLDNDCVKKILSNKYSRHIIDGKEVVVDLADPETKSRKNFCYP